LHQGGALAIDEGFEFVVEVGEFGVAGDAVEGSVITVVTLVFPDVDYDSNISINVIILGW
jgi:hypothetical protein